MLMASGTAAGGGSPPSISGVVELEIDQVQIAPDYALNAVMVEIVNPAGDGVHLLFDLVVEIQRKVPEARGPSEMLAGVRRLSARMTAVDPSRTP